MKKARLMVLIYCFFTPASALVTGWDIANGHYGWGIFMGICTWMNYRTHIFWINRLREAKARKK